MALTYASLRHQYLQNKYSSTLEIWFKINQHVVNIHKSAKGELWIHWIQYCFSDYEHKNDSNYTSQAHPIFNTHELTKMLLSEWLYYKMTRMVDNQVSEFNLIGVWKYNCNNRCLGGYHAACAPTSEPQNYVRMECLYKTSNCILGINKSSKIFQLIKSTKGSW